MPSSPFRLISAIPRIAINAARPSFFSGLAFVMDHAASGVKGGMKKMVRGFAAGCLPDSKLCSSEECML